MFIVTFFAINRFVTRFIMIHVKNMTKSLEMANRQIEMEQEQQKELLAGISHDIRTPLTAIKAYAEGSSRWYCTNRRTTKTLLWESF